MFGSDFIEVVVVNIDGCLVISCVVVALEGFAYEFRSFGQYLTACFDRRDALTLIVRLAPMVMRNHKLRSEQVFS